MLAFGSADYRTYCYDLRNARAPWCVLAGHEKTVSYVKFLDSGTLVTASTDNTLKLWDLKKTTHTGASTSACSLTFSGHTNEKVGICIYITLLLYLKNLNDFWLVYVGFAINLFFFQNFVGLSTADGYIACGSETNEVQHKFLFVALFYPIIKCKTIIC